MTNDELIQLLQPTMEYFDKDGLPISVEKWRDLFGDTEYRQVAYNENVKGDSVSTVWMGLAATQGPEGPLVFESQMYQASTKETSTYKYATQEQALAHHQLLANLIEADDNIRTTDHDSPDRWEAIVREIK
jgi:hypothetical protein